MSLSCKAGLKPIQRKKFAQLLEGGKYIILQRNIFPTILAGLNYHHLHKAAWHLRQPNPAQSEK